jgi:hypothetical protein
MHSASLSVDAQRLRNAERITAMPLSRRGPCASCSSHAAEVVCAICLDDVTAGGDSAACFCSPECFAAHFQSFHHVYRTTPDSPDSSRCASVGCMMFVALRQACTCRCAGVGVLRVAKRRERRCGRGVSVSSVSTHSFVMCVACGRSPLASVPCGNGNQRCPRVQVRSARR